MAKVVDLCKYYVLTSMTRGFDYFGVANKNGPVYQAKRRYLLKIVPDAKILAEISGVAHAFYHPGKKAADVDSMRSYLGALIEEGRKRNMQEHAMFTWAEALLKDNYLAQSTEAKPWVPDFKRLEQVESVFHDRTTTRDVKPDMFDKKIIYRLIQSAIEAPSSCNKQGWRFIIFDTPEMRETIAKIKRQSFLKNFPYIIACCFDKGAYMGTDAKMTPYLDCGGALMNLANAATAIGLATCWCNFSLKNAGAYRHKQFRDATKLPKNLIPVSFIALGMAKNVMPKPPREPIKFYLPYEK